MANPSLQIGNSNWAIKEDNLLGYSTAGTRFVPQPITMTRASAGTRVNSQGLVETVELLGSEEVVNGDFNNGTTDWTVTGSGTASIVDDALNYSNTVNGSWFAQFISQAVSFVQNKIYKVTFKAKNISGSVNLRITHQSHIVFNNNLTSSFVDYTVYYTAQANNDSIRIFCNDAIGEFQIDNISIKESTKNNLARVDYDGTASSLLAEPQRTNLITYSEDFSNAIWQKQTGIVPTYNTTETLSPDGTYNATKFIGTGSTGVFKASIIVSGNISRSVYLKSVTGTTTATFKEPNTGTPSAISLTITNEWQRFEMIGDNGSSSQGLWIDDITSDGLYMWGAQVEAGSYATSYIPTSGSSVTRVQDQYSKTGISNLINSEEGVLFVEFENIVDSAASIVMIALTDGSASNRISIFISGGLLSTESAGSGTNLGIYSKSFSTGFNKIALKYKVNDCALWINGTEYTDTSFAAFSTNTLNTLSFDRGDGSQSFFGKVKQLQVFKTALTDSELATLTT